MKNMIHPAIIFGIGVIYGFMAAAFLAAGLKGRRRRR